MKAGLLVRLAKLERHQEAAEAPNARVVRLGPDGEPEPGAFDHVWGGPLCYLPRKAPSVDVWYAQVRQRWEGKDSATVAQAWWEARPWLEEEAR
jgi:hypothetical protein